MVAFVSYMRIALLAQLTLGASLSTVENHFNKFYHFQISLDPSLPPSQAALSIAHEYDRELAPFQVRRKLGKLSAADLRLLYRGADTTSLYMYAADRVRDMQSDFSELQRRSIATALDEQRLYVAFIQYRNFTAAGHLALAHTSGERAFTALRDARAGIGPTRIVLHDSSQTMTRATVDLGAPAKIVVVSSPLCHFCQAAVRVIDREPDLRKVMRSHATWLVPPDGTLQFEDVRRWNRAHPNESMSLIYSPSEWPMVERWGTPTFYFFSRNKLVATIAGWSNAEEPSRLRRALKHVGLLPAT